METMKAAVFTESGKIEIQDLKKPVIKPNELLVEIKASAICTWEQRVYQGINKVNFPFIGGHEEAGVVVEVGGDVDKVIWKVGDRVVVGLLTSCGECYYCRKGEEGSCQNFNYEKLVGGLPISGMGGFAQYLAVPTKNAFKISDKLSYEMAALAEPLSCVVHSIEIGNVKLGQNVLVIGAGIMGVFHALLAKNKGARVIVSEPDEKRRKLLNSLGILETFNPLELDMVKKIKELTDDRGVDIIFNTTAVSAVAQQCLDMVALYGTIILYSSYHPDTPISVSPNTVHRNMISISGSANSNSSDFAKAIKLIEDGIIDPSPVLSEIVDFENIEEGIKKGIDPSSYRVVVRF